MTILEEKRLIHTVNDYFLVDIKSRSRKRELIDVKHAFRYGMRKLGYRVADIGRMMDCDHATVLHSVKAANNLIETEAAFGHLVGVMGGILSDFHVANKLRTKINENIAKKSIMATFCDLLHRSSEFIDYDEVLDWLDKANIEEYEYMNLTGQEIQEEA